MNVISEKLQLIEKLSGNSRDVNRLLDKVIDYLVADDQKKLARFRDQLEVFEKQYGMTTAEFQRRFDSGELGDAPQWFDWDGLATLAASLEAKLKAVDFGHE